MMLRRVVAVGAVLAAGSGLAAVIEQPASATPSDAEVYFRSHAAASPSGCTTTADHSAYVPYTVNGGTHTSSWHTTGQAGGADYTGDVTLHGRTASTSRVIRIGASGSLAARLGSLSTSPCSASYRLEAGTDVDVVPVPTRSWVIVSSATTGSGVVGGSYLLAADAETVVAQSTGKRHQKLIPHGTYMGAALYTAIAHAPSHQAAVSRTGTFAALIKIVSVGTRRTQSGSGQGYVSFGNRSCAHKSVHAFFSAAERKRVKRITFYVNGRKRMVLTGAALRRHGKTLGKIPARSGGKVRAVIVKKSGRVKRTASSSWPCA